MLSVSVLYSFHDGIINENKAVGGMRIGMRNQGTGRELTPVLLGPPQIPPDLTWDQNQDTALGGQQPTAWAMAQPLKDRILNEYKSLESACNDIK